MENSLLILLINACIWFVHPNLITSEKTSSIIPVNTTSFSKLIFLSSLKSILLISHFSLSIWNKSKRQRLFTIRLRITKICPSFTNTIWAMIEVKIKMWIIYGLIFWYNLAMTVDTLCWQFWKFLACENIVRTNDFDEGNIYLSPFSYLEYQNIDEIKIYKHISKYCFKLMRENC